MGNAEVDIGFGEDFSYDGENERNVVALAVRLELRGGGAGVLPEEVSDCEWYDLGERVRRLQLWCLVFDAETK